MSYRDLRNFSEAMRVLGFPKPISLESFRTPNWDLMEECLRWLAARVEPDAELGGGKQTVEQRVALVTHAIALFHSRANIKLNGKRVYGADGWAVRELMKVAAMLRAALDTPASDDHHHDTSPLSYDFTSRLSEIKQARALATDITAQGAFLYDLLAKEAENKEQREQALSRPLDMSGMEGSLRRALDAVAAQVAAARDHIDNVAASEAALDAKLERKRAELVRAEKRLHTVQKIKPAYQGELTALETEIEQLWDQYVLRYRCVEALKHQLSVLESAQAEAAEEQQAAIMQLIHKYEAEDVLGKLSDSDDPESSDDGKDISEVKQPRPATRPKTRLRIKTAGTVAAEARRAFGSMAARDSLDDIRDEDDSRSDSDFSDKQAYGDLSISRKGAAGAAARGPSAATSLGGGDVPSRWSRARPRPATRTLAAADDDDFADLIEGVESGEAGDSLGSSSESELRVASARGSGRPARPSAQPARASALSDNEF
ncbi:clusterin-associated protein 1 isoform X1 [Spodoptera litura]|uniref:Clusterin-associated protein 1 isoform X1 n=1 Tax=Spodoptera litura TaxID=69820 RepID=A0A9J7EGZ4_SPOLT|nr:clusterin-associated protein 1 isoform X1 [Spodoptera litura]